MAMHLLRSVASSITLTIIAVFLQVTPSASFAGEIHEAPEIPQCDYFYFGEVEEGDAQKIEDAIRPTASGTDLCLDSPGGSFLEGIKMFHTIWNKDSVRTRVLDGDICMSACAIAFMGGSMLEGTGVIRFRKSFLEPGSQLGFHSPSLNLPEGGQYSSETVEFSYALALQSSERMHQLTQINEHGVEGMSDFLYSKILETRPSDMYIIDTIGKASLAKIHLSQVPIRDINWDGILNVCDTAYLLADTGIVMRDRRPYWFSDLSEVGDDGTGRPIQIEDRTWSWSTESTMEFVVRGYPAAHKNELFCRVTLSRYYFTSEQEKPLWDRSDEFNLFGVTLWHDAYVPVDDTFARYAEGNSRTSERLSVPWTAMWPPSTRLDSFLR
jgi:hypothetical protein